MTAARPRDVGGTLDLAWWSEDPERWDLLRFEAAHDAADLPLDRWSKDRQDVLEALVLAPGPIDHDFARFLLEQEVWFHRHCRGCSHTIEIAALLLAEHRRPGDVRHLWEAILTSFDTWGCLPHQLLLACGATEHTLSYVTGSDHGQRDDLLGYLHKLQAVTGDDVAALAARRRRHYTDILRELDAVPERDDDR
ncbi:hypothetical protein [Streptomyces sp. NPDC001380]|uniref:hypothetical protein n=1 Tax=Streptomyces sp. NPDC001380 TaxID=3364566 RepID=UPI0036740C00